MKTLQVKSPPQSQKNSRGTTNKPAGSSFRIDQHPKGPKADPSNILAQSGAYVPSTVLTRKEIHEEFKWSPRSTARLEKRGLLSPVILFRRKLYWRSDIEALLRNSMGNAFPSRSSVPNQVWTTTEVTI